MRMSCNGCRVLRKGCSEDCSIRPCLQWIKSPESQANATVFLAKFYGRAGLMNLVNAGPEHLRPAIFRSLLYEACGRIVNPIYGSVGLLWSGSWQLCQAAVEAVLKGESITPINSDVAASGRGPPLKVFDIRHVSKDDDSAASHDARRVVKTRKRAAAAKPKGKGTGIVPVEPDAAAANRSGSHDSSLSHQSEAGNAAVTAAAESESDVSVENSVLFRGEPESGAKGSDPVDEVGLELTLGSRAHHAMPVKKRRIGVNDFCGGVSDENGPCKMELGLQRPTLRAPVLP